MKNIFLVALILLFTADASLLGQSNGQILKELNATIENSGQYDAVKFQKIASTIRAYEAQNNKQPSDRYHFYSSLYEEYKIFKFDTAFLYAKKLEEIALLINDPLKIAEAKTKLAFVLLSAGMYGETNDVISRINIQGLPDSLKAAYYLLRGRYFYDVADYNNDKFFYPVYFSNAGIYLDSALALYPPQSFEYIYYSGLKQMKGGDLDKAFGNFSILVSRKDLSEHELAVAASTLSYIYFRKSKMDTAINYQAIAAIADIRSSTKETFAILNLAQLLFQAGNFKSAALYIKKAIDDASSYGARQRKVQLSTIMPIIQSSEINYIENQRKLWILYASVVSLVLILFIFLLVTIFRQNKKLTEAQVVISEAHGRLSEANDQLHTVNTHLQDVNSKLEDANKIKEEYVGYFFTINAEFFQKMERFKKIIEEKIHYGKFNEIKFVVNEINIASEKEGLLKSFDKAFLKLFPHFIDDFNGLFDEDHQVKIQERELLNTDLRIYALIRLGIRENEKIAEILEYSVKSIYAYKTKIRNRAKYPKEEFEQRIMNIKSI
ncbi:MAG: tetratricopeptide repeat protein [Gloeobacteraceae cyanobacterium ES-bin-316]|nr:tetratricopeptide repeat protein [Ferruginibacter sp.]